MTKLSDNTFILRFKDGSAYNFDSNGKLINITDKNNNHLNFEYASEKLSRVYDDSGLNLAFDYNVAGRITNITDPLGRKISYEYNDGNLAKVTDAMGNSDLYMYQYNHKLKGHVDRIDNTRLFSYYDGTEQVKNIKMSMYNRSTDTFLNPFTTFSFVYESDTTYMTDAMGYVTSIQMNSLGNPIKIIDPLGGVTQNGWDSSMNMINFIDENGHETTYEYDIYGNLIKKIDPSGNSTLYKWDIFDSSTRFSSLLTNTTNARGFTTNLGYDIQGNVNKIEDATENISTFNYDEFGHTTSVIDFRGLQTSFTYDVHGFKISAIDATGNISQYEYDSVGRLLNATDANGHITRNVYDDNDRLVKVIDATGNATLYEYNAVGSLIRTIDAKGHATDASGNIIGKVDGITDASGKKISFEYDKNGNLNKYITAMGSNITTAYDALNRVTSITDALGNAENYTYDAAGNRLIVKNRNGDVTAYTYDTLNRLIKITDASGNTTNYAYDAENNMVSAKDANGYSTLYDYDALNRKVRKINSQGNEEIFSYDANGNLFTYTDGKGNSISYEYDPLNRVKKLISPLGYQTQYNYDAVGNIINRVDANGNTITYSYDELNRLSLTNYPDNGQVKREYDAVGNLILTANVGIGLNDITTLSYDELDRLSSSKVNYGAFDKTINYTYDADGNRASIKDPNGGITKYQYDPIGRLVNLTNPDGQSTKYNYDAGGRRIKTIYPNSATTDYSYDALNRELSIINKKSNGNVISSYSYTYDGMGNRLSMTEANGNYTTYEYDELYRLLNVTYPSNNAVQYEYDAAGNRITEEGTSSIAYTYDAENRLITAGTTSYAYDNNGNTISKTNASGTTTYEYDYVNRLAKVKLPNTNEVSYQYSPTGNRLSRADSSGTTYYLYDSEDILMELTNTGVQKARYVHGPGIDEPVSSNRDGVTGYYLSDGLGSITSLIDASGNPIATYQYSAFGKIIKETGTLINPYKFTGREYDAITGVYYYRSRYYDSEVGRFLTKDLPDLAKSSNLYTYVGNNPVNFIDPYGYVKWWALGGNILGVVGSVGEMVIGAAIAGGTGGLALPVGAALVFNGGTNFGVAGTNIISALYDEEPTYSSGIDIFVTSGTEWAGWSQDSIRQARNVGSIADLGIALFTMDPKKFGGLIGKIQTPLVGTRIAYKNSILTNILNLPKGSWNTLNPIEKAIENGNMIYTNYLIYRDLLSQFASIQTQKQGSIDNQLFDRSGPSVNSIIGVGRTYTSDTDFDKGTLAGLEHETVHDQLRLSRTSTAFPFIWVPNTGQGTISKVDTVTGKELGRYRVVPTGLPAAGSTSRTTVDLMGNVWVGNRQAGTVVKVGLSEAGQCIDRNGDGTIQTSIDTNGDGDITGTELLAWGSDECVLYEVVLITGKLGTFTPGTYNGGYDTNYWGVAPRGLAIDAANNLWAGTYSTSKYYYINATGQIKKTLDVSSWGHNAYGAAIDKNGILWSADSGSHVLRINTSNLTDIKKINIPSTYGIGLDFQNYLFVGGSSKLTKVNINDVPNPIIWTKSAKAIQGVAVTSDNNVWVAGNSYNSVSRYTNDGNLVATISGFSTPSGVAIDAAGKVWETDVNSEYIRRINTSTNTVDLTKRIIGSGGHYTYSDMTGFVARGITTTIGTWTAIYDGGAARKEWGRLSWNGDVPAGGSITVRIRTSDTMEGLQVASYQTVKKGFDFTAAGRYIQMETTLTANTKKESPILYDLTIEPASEKSISGMVFDDANGNGVKDAGETGLSGIIIQLSKISIDAKSLVRSTVTDANGNYNFMGLTSDSYKIEADFSGFARSQTYPAGGSPQFVIFSDTLIEGKDFGAQSVAGGQIRGIKFNDLNGNGVQNPGELGIAGVTICIWPSSRCTVTDSSGNYAFTDIPTGKQTVYEIVPQGNASTTPTLVDVTLNSGEIKTVNFGNRKLNPPPSDIIVPGSINENGVPEVFVNNPLAIRKDLSGIADNIVSVKLTLKWGDGTVKIADMAKLGVTNVWEATFSPTFPSGAAEMTFNVDIEPAGSGPEDAIQIGDIVFMDPSGKIKSSCTDAPIKDATVTLLVEFPPTSGNFVQSPSSNQIPSTNPQITREDGKYGWMTPPGKYKVRAEKTDYISAESNAVTVSPPVFDLDLSLTPVGGCQISDTTPPVIESITLYPVNATPGVNINLTVRASDNVGVIEVKADGVSLIYSNGEWNHGSITAPSTIGSYTVTIRANDSAGNIAEKTADYKVVAPKGSIGVGISPKTTTAPTTGTTINYIVIIKSTQNFDDIVQVNVTTDGLPLSYQMPMEWFNWNNQTIRVASNVTVKLPLTLTIPPGQIAGKKALKVRANSTIWTTKGFDTGMITIS